MKAALCRRMVRFHDPQSDQRPAGPETDGQWDGVPGICVLLQKAASSNQLLRLRLENGELTYRLAQYGENEITERHPEVTQSLAHFLCGDQTPFPFRKVRRAERFALAVVLANALLHLYEGPWCVQYWETTQISFRKGSHPAVPDFRRPYLLTRCESVNSVAPRAQIFEHPYPSLYAFGCLLLGMELGRPIDPNSLQDVRNAMEEASDTRSDLGESFEQYFEAINACLNIYTFKPGATFQNRQFMDEVYAAVVYPLETVLYKSFPSLLGKITSPAGPLDVLSVQTLRSIPNAVQKAPPAQTSTTTQGEENSGVFLHDHVNDPDSLNSEKYARLPYFAP